MTQWKWKQSIKKSKKHKAAKMNIFISITITCNVEGVAQSDISTETVSLTIRVISQQLGTNWHQALRKGRGGRREVNREGKEAERIHCGWRTSQKGNLVGDKLADSLRISNEMEEVSLPLQEDVVPYCGFCQSAQCSIDKKKTQISCFENCRFLSLIFETKYCSVSKSTAVSECSSSSSFYSGECSYNSDPLLQPCSRTRYIYSKLASFVALNICCCDSFTSDANK